MAEKGSSSASCTSSSAGCTSSSAGCTSSSAGCTSSSADAPSSASTADGAAVPSGDKQPNPGPYSDPIYKQISRMKGEVNRMTKEELKVKLKEMRMDTRGVKEVLKKRLKNVLERRKLAQARVTHSEEMADYLVVIDYEATCEENVDGYPHEIIEFPAVLVCTKQHIIVDEFREFCKPRINPILTPFCKTLTGISQDQVDSADYFPDVMKRVEDWFTGHGLGTEKTFVVVTDGPWDMSRFLHSQCNQCRIKFPSWARTWINIRKSYRNYYGFRSAKLTTMLVNLGMEFVGQQHSGIDDARNIARIAMRLLEDGAVLHPNEKMYSNQIKENKKICVDVVPCTGNDDDLEVVFDDEATDGRVVTYSYNGKYEVSMGGGNNGKYQESSMGGGNNGKYQESSMGGGNNGKYQESSMGGDTKAKGQKKVSGGEKIDWAEDVDCDNLEDVSDLMYWMQLKGK